MASASCALLVLAVLVFTSAPIHVAHGCGINVVNSCSYPVTTCAESGSAGTYQYQLAAGGSQYLDFGSACKWPSGVVYASITGNCANPDRPLANLAEFTIGPSDSAQDTYDLSNVEAYTIGMGISVINSAGGQCTTISCTISDIRSFCQGDNRLVSEPSGALSCVNTDGPGLVATPNTMYFKRACPQAFSYSLDNPTSQFTCNTGSNYQVTFCPGGSGSLMNTEATDTYPIWKPDASNLALTL